MTTHALLGLLAGGIELASFPIYLRSIFRSETRPDRVTWWILALVSGMITVSYYASGARNTLWLPVAYTTTALLIAVLSVYYGEGPVSLHKLDRISLAGALISATIWALLRSPVPSLFMNIATESIGLLPTIHKAYRKPATENKAAWILGMVAAAVSLLAVEQWTFVILAYPVYVFMTNALIVYFLSRKRS